MIGQPPIEAFDIIWETPDEFKPGVDFHDPILSFTIPVRTHEVAIVGKGDNKHEVQKIVNKTLAVRSDHSFMVYDRESVQANNFSFPDTFLQQKASRWPLEGEYGVQSWTHNTTPSLDKADLFVDLRRLYHKYMEFTSEDLYDYLPLYVLSSYLFRLWPSIGYLHLNGTRASGKTQCLQTLEALALNTMLASNTSTSALFRTASGAPGLICIDEAENLSGEDQTEIRLIINAGYKEGGKVQRTEKDNAENFKVTEYPVYGPKVLASINSLELTVQSRCIVVPTQPALRKVPTFKPADPAWPLLRARIYSWALQHVEQIARHTELWETTLHEERAPKLLSREWEVGQSIIVLADYIGGQAMSDPIIKYLDKYFVALNKAQDETDRTQLTLKTLPRIVRTLPPNKAPHLYTLLAIHEVVTSYIEEDQRDFVKTRTVSKYLKNLGFNDRQAGKGGSLISLPEDKIRSTMRQRRVEPFAEDIDWFEREDFTEETLPIAIEEEPTATDGEEIEKPWWDKYVPDPPNED